jgi:DNA repair protein RadC
MKTRSWMVKVIRVAEAGPSIRCIDPMKARRYWNAVIKRQPWFDSSKETLVVLMLSTRFDIFAYSLVSIGSLNQSLAHPREIFRPAIATGACAIVMLHNHPSGDPTPSQQDRTTAERIELAGDLLAIKVLDQIIIGRPGKYFSLAEHRLKRRKKRA